MIEESLKNLQSYIEHHHYKGYDPYDALKSPLFNLPIFRSNKLIRFGSQQFIKRFPVNLRTFLAVPKGLNPVTLGLMIQGYAYAMEANPKKTEEYFQKIDRLADQLQSLSAKGYSGVCWGYDFDWEARHAKIPAYQPTVVATGIITNGLFTAWRITKSEKLKELIVGSIPFILSDLNRSAAGDTFCFSYSPFDQQKVFNASMKGVRLLAQAYFITKKEEYKTVAGDAVQYVMNHQNNDGSWHYSLASKGNWVDNYHTGYVLDCLDDYIKLCDVEKFRNQYENGYEYYKKTFIGTTGMPYFYSNQPYPADCTAASQTILTLIRNGDLESAYHVAKWTIQNMQAKNGSFYFRKYRYFNITTSFMRWSNAWMFSALSYLALSLNFQSKD